MKLEDTDLAHLVQDVHIEKEGVYYFFDTFVISEINKGVVYNWDTAQNIINAVTLHYGENNLSKISYISNRVNSYSVKPTDWFKFYKSNIGLKAYAIVSYTQKGFVNAAIESQFLKFVKHNKFNDLHIAIDWVNK